MRLVFPDINTNINDTYLGIGSFVLKVVKEGKISIDDCHAQTEKLFSNTNEGMFLDFNLFLLTLVFLFSLNAIEINQNGEVYVL